MRGETLKVKARDELIRYYKDSTGNDFHSQGSKQQSIGATKFYIDEIHNKLKNVISEEDIDDGVVDGSNDLGCDFIARNDNHVIIIQSKFRKPSTQEEAKEITYFKSILKRFRDPKLEPNKHLAEIIGDIDWERDSFELVFLTFGKMDKASQARKITEQLADYPMGIENLDERCEWIFLDEEDINVSFRSARDLTRGISNKQISLYPEGEKNKKGSSSVIKTKAGDYNSYIMTLSARQIVTAYDQLGRDALFSLNIRNYIGNTKTNSQIIETAQHEPDQFFIFNNGVSCLATRVNLKEDCLEISGLQVINGAQTVKALVHVSKDINRLGKNYWDHSYPRVLVRITEVPEGYGQTGRSRERITQYNNTQNTIKISDFRSNDSIQTNLREQFDKINRRGKKVAYIAKRTDKIPANTDAIRLDEYCKSVYTFLYNFVDFSGSASFLYNEELAGGYCKVFGDGEKLWETMPEDEFRLRASIFWISQEITAYLKKTRKLENDPDSKAAIERKWLLVYSFSSVVKRVYGEEGWKAQIRKLYKGDWSIEDDDKKGAVAMMIYKIGKSGVITAYKNAKRYNKEFVHRNWMRSKNTPAEIDDAIENLILPNLPHKVPHFPG